MRETPFKMHMHDIVTIDTIVFEIVGRETGLLIVNFLKYPGLDKVKTLLDRIGLYKQAKNSEMQIMVI